MGGLQAGRRQCAGSVPAGKCGEGQGGLQSFRALGKVFMAWPGFMQAGRLAGGRAALCCSALLCAALLEVHSLASCGANAMIHLCHVT